MGEIRQSANYLSDLLQAAEKGRLLPASFQRPYVWNREAVEAFWSSLLRGFPVGSFLVWTPPRGTDLSAIGRSRLGPVTADRDADCAIILDGQNRLASFAWSLADLGPRSEGAKAVQTTLDDISPLSSAERATWLTGDFLAADPAERTIRFRTRDEAAARLLVPAAVLASSSKLNPFIRAWEKSNGYLPDDQIGWLSDEANRRIMESRVTVTNLDGLSPEDALDAFRHIARAGVPMSDEDFEQALSFAFPTRAPGP